MKTHAFPVQLAKEGFLLGKYTESIALLKPLSDAGTDADAQFLHAFLHFWDDDLSRVDALEKLTQIADQNHAEANYLLAVCPDLTPPCKFQPPQTDEQFTRLQHAAELGSDAAKTDLAECYMNGKFVAIDNDRTLELLQEVYAREAYENGVKHGYYAKNCFLLGRLLLQPDSANFDLRNGLGALSRCIHVSGNPYLQDALHFTQQFIFNWSEFKTNEIAQENLTEFLVDLENKVRETESVPTSQWNTYLMEYCQNSIEYDLRNADFNALADFVFDHFPIRRGDYDSFRWHRNARVIFDPGQLIRFYTEMFTDPAFLIDRYEKDQIREGFEMDGIRGWADWTISCLIIREETTLDEAEAVIRAMYGLFEHLFSKPDYESIGYMWWDIGYGECGTGWKYDGRIKHREMTEADWKRLSQTTFETQVRVLNMKNRPCQEAAIHAFWHSRHPDKTQVIQKWLDENPDMHEIPRIRAIAAMEMKWD